MKKDKPFVLYCKSKPIPIQTGLRDEAEKRKPIPISQGEVSREKLVDVRALGFRGENYYFNQPQRPPGAIPELWLRESVVARLVLANHLLEDIGLELFIRDAWRPLTIQERIKRHIWKTAQEANPAWSKRELRNYVRTAIAEVPEPRLLKKRPPPHTTGGALDVTLCTLDGNLIDLGRGELYRFPDYFELKIRETPLTSTDFQILLNRRVLYWAMAEVGFVVNPYEWWHFSWGDQYWARVENETQAHYGFIKKPH